MPTLFMFLIGCTPEGRHIEQHDIFFGIGESVKVIIPDIIASWPEAKGKLHFDAWREVTKVNDYEIKIIPNQNTQSPEVAKLFFINLGGYKLNEFEEFHYKMLIAASDKGEAITQAKQTAFYKHTGFEGAPSHVDDKWGIDVDDVFEIRDILPIAVKEKFSVVLTRNERMPEDELHLGYFKIDSF